MTKNLITKYIDLIFLIPFLMVLSTVFVINNKLAYGVISGKYFWFYMCMGICSITMLLWHIRHRKHIRFTPTDILFSLFVISGLLSSYFNNQFINTKIILLCLLFVLYFYFKIIISQNKFSRYFFELFFIITGLIEIVWGVLQYYEYLPSQHNLFPITGSFFNPGPYSGYLALVGSLSFHFILKQSKVFTLPYTPKLYPYYIRSILSTVTFLCVVFILFFTVSRASWIALLGGCIFSIIIYLKRKSRFRNFAKVYKKSIISISCLLSIVCIVGCLYMYNLKKDSADGRLLIWKISLNLLPSFQGVGIGNFSGSYGNAQADYFSSTQIPEKEIYVADSAEYAYNEFLQLWIELGIIPFVLFILLIVWVFYRGFKKKCYKEISLLIPLLIFASLSYPFSILPILIIFILNLSMCSVKEENNEKCEKSYVNNTLFVLISSIIIVLPCLYNRYPVYAAYKKWKSVIRLYEVRQYDTTAGEFKSTAPYLNDQVRFMMMYSQNLNHINRFEESNEIADIAITYSCDPSLYMIKGLNYQSMGKLELAELNFKKAANIIPNRLYPYFLLAKLYMQSGDSIKAQEAARTMLQKKPKVESHLTKMLQKEMKEYLKQLN